MRNRGIQIGAVKKAATGAANRDFRREVAELQPKFHPGADPLEREAGIRVLQPTDAQQLEQMTKMLEKLYEGATPEQQQALALWKMQVAQGTIRDQVKLDFMRRFYFWLLGRGDQSDHDKTLWGRANTAVYNKEVAAYIDMFVDKRTKYVMKLRMLANNVPDTLNGLYLYYKYIVNGRLKQIRAPDGTINYDMTDEDYLQDFDMFQQVFETGAVLPHGRRDTQQGYNELAAGLPTMGERNVKAFDSAGVPAPVNNSGLASGEAAAASISRKRMEDNNVRAVSDRLSLNAPAHQHRDSFGDRSWERHRSSGGGTETTIQNDSSASGPSDLEGVSNVSVAGAPDELGQASTEAASISGGERRDTSFIGNDPNVTLAKGKTEIGSLSETQIAEASAADALKKSALAEAERRREEEERRKAGKPKR